MNLLITGAWREANKYIKDLEAYGHQIQMMQWEKDPLPCTYEWVEGVICNGLFLHHPIENFTSLRYIQLTSAGYDRVPLEYIQANEIELHNAKGVYSIPMAEHAVSGVLQLYRQTRIFDRNQREHRWEKVRSLPELYGKTVCIIGCGSVGIECAKRFKAFGCRLVGIRRKRTVKHRDTDSSLLFYFDSLETADALSNVLPLTDILILAVPLTDETNHLVDRRKLSRMNTGAVVVNLSRGGVVETQALIQALQKGSVGGAVLDVFEQEPLSEDSPLWGMENVILTPHNCYAGDGNRERLFKVIRNGLQKKMS